MDDMGIIFAEEDDERQGAERVCPRLSFYS
jgi:hypothetical protein